MKGKSGAVLSLLVCIGLGIALLVRHNRAVDEKQKAEAQITQLSNQWTRAETLLDEQKKVNVTLNSNLDARTAEAQGLSNKLTVVSGTLAQTEAQAKAAAKVAEEEMAKRDTQIAELEGRNQALDKQALDMKTSIGNLESQIMDTQKKLAASEGDREVLLKELKRLQAEKADLERQFNDLLALRDQVKRLKDELSVARKLEWIRRGLYGSPDKGGEKLQEAFAASAPARTNFDLNVEIRQGGGATVVPPATNSPAINAPPPP